MELSEVRALLPINRHRLDDHLTTNSAVMEEIGREVAHRAGAVRDLKRRLDTLEAKLIAELKEDDPKMSNPVAEKGAKRDPAWQHLWQEMHLAQCEEGEWEAAQTAWKQRSFDLRSMADLFGHQYFAINTASGPDTARDSIRQAIRRATKEVDGTKRRTLVNT
jgi:hypothetical protein